MRNQASLFRMVAFGYAAENRQQGSVTLEVMPAEIMGYMQGELSSDVGVVESEGVDAEGRRYTVSVSVANTIKASWYPHATNLLIPPSIRRGERVELWQFADVDQYYWMPTGLDEALRRLDTYIIGISATRDETTKTLSVENSYTMEFCSHTKAVTIRTSKADGEPYAYVVQLNGKDGKVLIEDDAGNYLELVSKEAKWSVVNAQGAEFTIAGRNGLFSVPDQMKFSAKSMLFSTQSYTVETQTYAVNAKSASYKTTNYSVTASAGGSFSGGFTGNGNFTINGNSNFDGTIRNNGTNIGSSHRHPNGNPFTGNPQ